MNTLGKYEWRAGVSRVNITPAAAIWLAGWGGRTKPSQGVDHPIYARALALADAAGNRAVWLSVDLLGFSAKMVGILNARLKRRYGLERSQVLLSASHNHSGPVTGDVLTLYYELSSSQKSVIAQYTSILLDALVEGVGLALRDSFPATLSYGVGTAGFASNRRRIREGGELWANVVDHDVPVLAIRDRSQMVKALVFGYACHATTVHSGRVNGDYPGFACSALEAKFPGAVALFMTGCAGDANPVPRFKPGLAEAYGLILSSAVESVLAQDHRDIVAHLSHAFGYARLPFTALPSRSDLMKIARASSGARLREAKYFLDILKSGRALPTYCNLPVHVWRLGGEVLHITLGGEPVADYSIRIKRELGPLSTWVSGYADDLTAYIPSARVAVEGGYEGGDAMWEYGWPAPFRSGVEELVLKKVHSLVEETKTVER